MSRYAGVRSWWLDLTGITGKDERRQLLPAGGNPFKPWSAEFMLDRGPGAQELVRDLLATAGATSDDLPELRREALELLNLAAQAARMPGTWQVRS